MDYVWCFETILDGVGPEFGGFAFGFVLYEKFYPIRTEIGSHVTGIGRTSLDSCDVRVVLDRCIYCISIDPRQCRGYGRDDLLRGHVCIATRSDENCHP